MFRGAPALFHFFFLRTYFRLHFSFLNQYSTAPRNSLSSCQKVYKISTSSGHIVDVLTPRKISREVLARRVERRLIASKQLHRHSSPHPSTSFIKQQALQIFYQHKSAITGVGHQVTVEANFAF